MHDQILCVNQNDTWCDNMFLTNVETYLKILDNVVCGNIIWISQTSVRGDKNKPQRNAVSVRWNEGIKVVGTRLFAYTHSFYYLDAWNVSEHFECQDNIHFSTIEGGYYNVLAALFNSIIWTFFYKYEYSVYLPAFTNVYCNIMG
jgi:hypothetical protein